MSDEHHDLAWRNHIADWHLQRGMPGCGCDDDTPVDDLCPESVHWADEQLAHQPAPHLDGDPDPWSLDTWVAAWGHNATVVAGDKDFRLPNPPQGMNWLVTRMLVRGVKAVDIALMRFTDTDTVKVAQGRAVPEPVTVAAKARKIIRDTLT